MVYAESDGRVHVDDRGLAPLTVSRATLDAARARVGSYKHRLCVIEPDGSELPVDLLRQAVLAGLADAADHLASSSDSFGLPAWRKWARMMTATRGAKAWPYVFASGHGLAGALLSTYEGIQPVGLYGGHLRGLYAEFLDEAAGLLEEPRLADAATAWRAAAARWQALADTALPAEPFGRLRELMCKIHAAVIEEGDAGAAAAGAAATSLWALRRTLDTSTLVEPDELFPEMRELLEEIYARESEAAALWPS